MSETTNYICPQCMGPLRFDSESGKLHCDFCGGKYDPSQFEGINEEATTSQATPADEEQEILESWGKDAENMRAYSCSSCGAQLITESSTAATSCPYCGNPTIVPGQFSGVLKPDLIIPFKLNQADAEKALKRHYQKKLLLPGVFAQENHIREMKGDTALGLQIKEPEGNIDTFHFPDMIFLGEYTGKQKLFLIVPLQSLFCIRLIQLEGDNEIRFQNAAELAGYNSGISTVGAGSSGSRAFGNQLGSTGGTAVSTHIFGIFSPAFQDFLFFVCRGGLGGGSFFIDTFKLRRIIISAAKITAKLSGF